YLPGTRVVGYIENCFLLNHLILCLKLKRLFQDLLNSPTLHLTERSSFNDTNFVPYLAFICLVMSHKSLGFPNIFAKHWMLLHLSNCDNNALVHLVANDMPFPKFRTGSI